MDTSISISTSTSASDDNLICVICLNGLENLTMLKTLKCKHVLCGPCYKDLFAYQQSIGADTCCPLCRQIEVPHIASDNHIVNVEVGVGTHDVDIHLNNAMIIRRICMIAFLVLFILFIITGVFHRRIS